MESKHSVSNLINEKQKSNREKSDNVNWDNIYKCSDDLQRILQSKGMHVANIERSEADDIMALIKETVYEEYPDYNIIIVSADADIRQLIDFDEVTHQYCVVYNTTGRGKGSKRRMYATDGFLNWVNKEQNVDIQSAKSNFLQLSYLIHLFQSTHFPNASSYCS